MYKLTFIVSVIILGTVVCAFHNVDCNSCGEECKRACGTKQFKICCYNYLRKKRGPETLMVLSPIASLGRANLPFYMELAQDNMVEPADQFRYYPGEDSLDMHLLNDF